MVITSGKYSELALSSVNSIRKVKSSRNLPKWISITMLFIISMMNFGDNYAYDVPQAYQTPLRKFFGMSSAGTQALYSVYSFPNTFMPIVGGIFISKYGDTLSVLMFSMIMFVGNIIFTFGIWSDSYYMLIIGRLISGIGGENMITIQMVCVEKWFGDTHLSLAMGICLVVSNLGTMLNNFLTPFMVENLGNIFHAQVLIMIIVACSQFFCF